MSFSDKCNYWQVDASNYNLKQRSVTWNQFPIKNLQLIPCLFQLWSEVTLYKLHTSQMMNADPSRLIPQKPTENFELLLFCLCSIEGKKCTAMSFIYIFSNAKKISVLAHIRNWSASVISSEKHQYQPKKALSVEF